MPTANLGNMRIHYLIDDLTDPWRQPGEVKTVLMFHGSNRNLKFWTPWVSTIARDYRVLRLDAPGFGQSTWPKEVPLSKMRLPMFAETALRLMDHLKMDRVHWVGALSGGIIGGLFAAAYPERTASLTLCNTPYRISDEYLDMLSGGYKSMVECVAALGVGGWRERVEGSSLDKSKARPEMSEWIKQEIGKTRTEIGTAYVRACLPEYADLTDDLPKIKCPTLLMNGDRSPAMPLEMMVYMFRHIARCQMIVFPGLGGSVDSLIPERCAQATLEFIRGVDACP